MSGSPPFGGRFVERRKLAEVTSRVYPFSPTLNPPGPERFTAPRVMAPHPDHMPLVVCLFNSPWQALSWHVRLRW